MGTRTKRINSFAKSKSIISFHYKLFYSYLLPKCFVGLTCHLPASVYMKPISHIHMQHEARATYSHLRNQLNSPWRTTD